MDGDTVDVVTDLGLRIGWEQRIRLMGLNAYEMNDRDPAKRLLAVRGTSYVAARILNKDVILNTFRDRTEKYGRWLAVVYYLGEGDGWHNLNDELLVAGLAVPMGG